MYPEEEVHYTCECGGCVATRIVLLIHVDMVSVWETWEGVKVRSVKLGVKLCECKLSYVVLALFVEGWPGLVCVIVGTGRSP